MVVANTRHMPALTNSMRQPTSAGVIRLTLRLQRDIVSGGRKIDATEKPGADEGGVWQYCRPASFTSGLSQPFRYNHPQPLLIKEGNLPSSLRRG